MKAKKSGLLAPSAEQLRRIAITCVEAASCFEILAKRAGDVVNAGDAAELALRHRAAVAAVDEIAAKAGLPVHRVSTCERLRWEWFASTAAVLDGTPDARLAREGARLSRDAAAAARGFHPALRAALEECRDGSARLSARAAHATGDLATAPV